MKNVKLKPCPFCGGTKFYVGHSSASNAHVMCWKIKGGCGANIYRDIIETHGKDVEEKFENAIKILVERWNTRRADNGKKS